MSLDSGKLRDRVIVQSKTVINDSFGQPIESWGNYVSLWAWIKYTSGNESIKSGALQAETYASIRIRYRLDITTNMRVLFGSKIFNIKSVLPSDTRDYVDLVVSEGVNNG